MNKQIEEIAKVLEFVCDLQDKDSCIADCDICRAKALYTAGYRKAERGEWIKDEVGETLCSQCGVRPLYRKSGTTFATTFYPTRSNFCHNCGAKMKGDRNAD
jgi:hypothetical protein